MLRNRFQVIPKINPTNTPSEPTITPSPIITPKAGFVSPRKKPTLIPSNPPPLKPPITKPPITRPPIIRPPIIRPPIIRPPITKPPISRPPITRPPITKPPITRPPIIRPPISRPVINQRVSTPVKTTKNIEIIKEVERKQIENVGNTISKIKFPEIKNDDIISNERMIRIGDWIWSGSLDRFKIKSLNSSNISNLAKNGILKKGDIVSIRTNFLPNLYKCLNFLKEPIIIISNYSDKTVDNSLKYIADHPKIYHWFAINCVINHPKITKIPLGLGASHNSFGNLELLSRLITIKHNNPTKKIFINYKIDRLRPARVAINKCLTDQGLINTYGFSIEKYWSSIIEHEFIISPPGCGIDCYRIWETLYLGRIPIVIDNDVFETYKDLPILFVNNYNDLFVKIENIGEWTNKDFNWEKLKYKYWFNLIHNKKKECLGDITEVPIELPPLIDTEMSILEDFTNNQDNDNNENELLNYEYLKEDYVHFTYEIPKKPEPLLLNSSDYTSEFFSPAKSLRGSSGTELVLEEKKEIKNPIISFNLE